MHDEEGTAGDVVRKRWLARLFAYTGICDLWRSVVGGRGCRNHYLIKLQGHRCTAVSCCSGVIYVLCFSCVHV